MATSVTTSKQFSLNLNDFWKGLLVAVITPVFTIIIDSLNKGSLNFDWKSISITALAALLAYLGKNFFSPAVSVVTPTVTPPGTSEADVSVTNVTPKP